MMYMKIVAPQDDIFLQRGFIPHSGKKLKGRLTQCSEEFEAALC